MVEHGAQLTGQRVVAAAILALGIVFGIATWLFPDAPGYAQIGPRHFPALVSLGLIAVGALLLKEALGSGFRNFSEDPRETFNWPAFCWISAGLMAQLVLIASIGFILATALLFAAVAHGFGSPRPVRDFALGLAITSVVYVLFTRVLTLHLPWGAWIPG